MHSNRGRLYTPDGRHAQNGRTTCSPSSRSSTVAPKRGLPDLDLAVEQQPQRRPARSSPAAADWSSPDAARVLTSSSRQVPPP